MAEDEKEESEDNAEWVEPWDMDRDLDQAWTPPINDMPDGELRLRHRDTLNNTRADTSTPEQWRSLLDRMATPPRDTRSPPPYWSAELDSPGEFSAERTTPGESSRMASPPLREAVRESGDMVWLVTRRLNTKDNWQL